MQKTILITGATDGIGLETARMLLALGHHVLLHGRNPAKLEAVAKILSEVNSEVNSKARSEANSDANSDANKRIECYVADLSNMADVEAMAKAVKETHRRLDVLINNAGVYNTSNPMTSNGLDVRFVVNAIAPYLLSQHLMPLIGTSGRIINVSSAAQSPVDPDALTGRIRLSQDFTAYAQSKLALTMWSRVLSRQDNSPIIVAVNPGSMLGSKMVKQAFGVTGGDIHIGAEILTRAALSDEFESASGQYFDNDSGQFISPHPDVLNPQKSEAIVRAIEMMLR